MQNSVCRRRRASPSRSKARRSIDSGLPHSESHTTSETIPKIGTNHCAWPPRLTRRFNNFSPALWVIPPRCYWRYNQISEPIHRGSQLFYRFKTGALPSAFPLALMMYEVLKQQRGLDFDCIVPIPLSPDKQAQGQFNRTRILAQQLASVLRVALADVLTLSGPISKRQFLSAGSTQAHFEHQYHQLLHAHARIRQYSRILLLDDVCTEGSTLTCALRRIRDTHPHAQLSATTAGQMLLKSVVRDESLITGPQPPNPFTHVSP